MRTLATLIRMHRYQLDEKRRALADLENLRADIVGQGDRLKTELAHEQEVAKTVECGPFAYGGFARGFIERREKLMASLAEIDQRITAAQDALNVAFQDLKRHEIALAARQRRQREKTERLRQIELDEVSLEMHRRRSA